MKDHTIKLPLTAKLFRQVLLVFFSINMSFVFFHWLGDSLVNKEFVKTRVSDAFDVGAFVEKNQLHLNVPHGSPVNLIGIDQFTECFNALMLISPIKGSRIKAAVVPEYQTVNGRQLSCRDLNQISRNKVEQTQLEGNTKARLWHGAKPFTVLLLPKFEFYQIANLIQKLSILGLTLLLAYAFYCSTAAGVALVPFIITAIFGSGLDVYGGITNSLPYTAALFLPLFVAVVQSKHTFKQATYSAIVAGSIMAFVYILDGSLILALALLIYLLYFTTPGSDLTERWKVVLILCSVFVLSFFFSFLFKQLISIPFIGFEQVWKEFSDLIKMRMGTIEGGRVRSPWLSFLDQIGVYDIATSWNIFLKKSIVYAGHISWAVGIALAIAITVKSRSSKAMSDLLAYLMIAFVVFFRYTAMTSHSYQHWFIVSRYVFVYFGFGMSLLVWMTLLFKRINQGSTIE